MLTVNNLVGFGAADSSVAAAASFTANASSASTLTTYTFSSQSFGVAATDRYIVVATTSQTGTSVPVSSVTIGGIAATQLFAVVQVNNTVEFWIAAVPTGTSGSVAVTWSTSRSRCAVVIWRVVGLLSTTAYDTTQEFNFGSGAGNGDVDVPAGGVVLGMSSESGTGSRTWTWSGLTESVDTTYASGRSYTGATGNFASAQTALAISATPSANTTSSIFSAVALR